MTSTRDVVSAAVGHTADSVAPVQAVGSICDHNDDAASLLVGYAFEEMLGSRLDEVVRKRFRRRRDPMLRVASAWDVTRYGSGNLLAVAAPNAQRQSVSIRRDDGSVGHCIASLREASGRPARGRKPRRRIETLEDNRQAP